MKGDQEPTVGKGLLGKDADQCSGQRDRLAALVDGRLERYASFHGSCRFRRGCRQDQTDGETHEQEKLSHPRCSFFGRGIGLDQLLAMGRTGTMGGHHRLQAVRRRWCAHMKTTTHSAQEESAEVCRLAGPKDSAAWPKFEAPPMLHWSGGPT